MRDKGPRGGWPPRHRTRAGTGLRALSRRCGYNQGHLGATVFVGSPADFAKFRAASRFHRVSASAESCLAMPKPCAIRPLAARAQSRTRRRHNAFTRADEFCGNKMAISAFPRVPRRRITPHRPFVAPQPARLHPARREAGPVPHEIRANRRSALPYPHRFCWAPEARARPWRSQGRASGGLSVRLGAIQA